MSGVKRSRPRPNRANIQFRETNGQYSVGLDKLCVCDHTLGQHLAGNGSPGAIRTCIAHELPGGPTIVCKCEGFRPKRVRS